MIEHFVYYNHPIRGKKILLQLNLSLDPCRSLCLTVLAASKKHRVRFSNIMEVRQLPSTQALEAKLSRMSYPAAKDHEAMLRTVGKLTITDVAKISFFFCFVVSKSMQEIPF